MKSIDMEIHVNSHPGVVYERISGRTEAELQRNIWTAAYNWGQKGVWSDWETGRGKKKAYYPPQAITKIVPYSNRSFGTEE